MLRFWMIFNNPQENATVTRILSSLFLDDYLVDKVLAPRTRTSWSNPKSSKPWNGRNLIMSLRLLA